MVSWLFVKRCSTVFALISKSWECSSNLSFCFRAECSAQSDVDTFRSINFWQIMCQIRQKSVMFFISNFIGGQFKLTKHLFLCLSLFFRHLFAEGRALPSFLTAGLLLCAWCALRNDWRDEIVFAEVDSLFLNLFCQIVLDVWELNKIFIFESFKVTSLGYA